MPKAQSVDITARPRFPQKASVKKSDTMKPVCCGSAANGQSTVFSCVHKILKAALQAAYPTMSLPAGLRTIAEAEQLSAVGPPE